jgi:O-antigen ligase
MLPITKSTEKTIAILASLLIISIHFSTFATLITSIIITLLFIATSNLKDITIIIQQNLTIQSSLLLFLALLISTSYSAASYPQAFSTLAKYRELLLPLILFRFFENRKTQESVELYLIISLIFTLLVSTIDYLNLLPENISNLILKGRIAHSQFISFLSFYSLHKIYNKENILIWISVLLFSTINLLFISDGRTGQLIFIMLCTLFFTQIFTAKKAFILGATILAIFSILLSFTHFGSRFIEGFEESINFLMNSNYTYTSMGLRLYFWEYSLKVIAQSPFIGVGVGGLPFAAEQLIHNKWLVINPHNEYLLIGAQLGIFGLILFFCFLFSILKKSLHIPKDRSVLLQGALLTLFISCIFNSSILDHTEGHWFMTLIALFSTPSNKNKN